jgi:hypothetical protein
MVILPMSVILADLVPFLTSLVEIQLMRCQNSSYQKELVQQEYKRFCFLIQKFQENTANRDNIIVNDYIINITVGAT